MCRLWSFGAIALSVLLAMDGRLSAQVNPNGYIQTKGWNLMFPLLNPFGCSGGGVENMARNWVAPHNLGLENPRVGEEWGDIDYGATAAATGFDLGGLNDAAIWVTNAGLEQLFSLPPGTIPNGDVVDFQAIVDFLNNNIVPLVQARPLPSDNVVGLGTTYIENLTGGAIEVDLCSASDDSIQLWLNNKLITNVSACRGTAGSCAEFNRALLPPGISKISMLVWEGGGGWGGRVGVRFDGALLKDGNGIVAFRGAGTTEVGQEQYCVTRTAAIKPLNCPNKSVPVTLQGSGPGADAEPVTVTECVFAPNPAGITVSGVSNGGAVADKVQGEAGVIGGVFAGRAVIGTPCGLDSDTTFDGGTGEFISTAQTGGDIWDGGDVFEFAYTKVTGDFDVAIQFTSRVHSTGLGEWGKFGIMARKSLATDARFSMIQDHLPLLSDGARAAGRTVESGGGGMYEVGVPGGGHPEFFRLKRVGTVVSAWASTTAPAVPANDADWTLVNNDDWGSAPDVYLGFANSEHNSEGCAHQVVKFKVINALATPIGFDLPGNAVIGKTVTWNVTRGELNAGLSYTLGYSARAAVQLDGQVSGEAIAQGVRSINFDGFQTGPVGAFDTSHDIGSPPTVGTTAYTAATGSYMTAGSGADIWNGGDDFHYAYKAMTGDFLAECRITAISDPAGGTRWGRFGLMARWTCDRNSKYSMIVELGSDNVDTPRHQFRTNHLDNAGTNDSMQVSDGFFADDGLGYADVRADIGGPAGPRRPAWMRIVRQGISLYTFLANDDGAGHPGKWCAVGSDSVTNLPAVLLVGMAVQSHGSAGANLLTITYDNLRIEPLAGCAEFTPLLYETSASSRTDGLGTMPYKPRLVTARIAANAADAVAHGGNGLAVKNRNWFWTDLTVGSENLEGTQQLLWNNENRNFNPDGAGSPAATPLLRLDFTQASRVFIAWDARHVKGGSDNVGGTFDNGWFDFNNDVGTVNAQGWLRIGGSVVVDPGADILVASGDDNFARGGLWCKDFTQGEEALFYQTGFSGGRSPYVVFVRCGQTCSRGDTLATLDFEDAGDLGIAVQGGTFAPAVTAGRLRLTDESTGGSANAVWYGAAADVGAGGVPLADEGFYAEFDAYMKRTGLPGDVNPADGMTFAVFSTGASDGLFSALAPFPTGLDVATLRGDGGGALAYDSGLVRERLECHPSFAVEMDNWVGGGNNEPAGAGSPDNDGAYHMGIDVNGTVNSLQTNVGFGVPTAEMPDLFNPAGVHVEVMYRPDGAINVWVSGTTRGGAAVNRRRVLSVGIPAFSSGDLVFGFTGGTGGATCTQEIDNFRLSTICCELPDSVMITGASEAEQHTSVSLTAQAGASEHAASFSYLWELVSGSASLGAIDGSTLELSSSVVGDVIVRVTVNDGFCSSGASAEHTVSFVCPSAGDTHCGGVTVVADEGVPGRYVASASASDDNGDAISYTFRASNGVDPDIEIGPQAGSTATFDLTEGTWTISVTVDDDPACPDEAGDSTCTSDPFTVTFGTPFIRGDCNQDGEVCSSVSDMATIINIAILGTTVSPSCPAACDSNGDGNSLGSVDDALADILYIANYCFIGDGGAPPAPFPSCDIADGASCEAPTFCAP